MAHSSPNLWNPLAGRLEIGISTALYLAFGLSIALIAAQLAVLDTRRM